MPRSRLRRLASQPTVTYPLLAFGALVCVALVYYLPVTARQEVSLDQHSFRVLSRLGDQFALRVDAKAKAFRNAWQRRPRDTKKDWTEQFIESQVPGLNVVTCEGNEGIDPEVTLVADRSGLQLRLVGEQAQGGQEDRGERPVLCGTLSWAETLDPLLASLPEGLFDEVLLADTGGEVLFHTHRTGVRVLSMRGLTLRPEASETVVSIAHPAGDDRSAKSPAATLALELPEALAASRLRHVAVGGDDYRLYTSPLELALIDQRQPAGNSTRLARFAVCGLVRADRFESRRSAIPNSALLTVVLVTFVLIGASWPALKFKTIRPTEVIHRRSGLAYVWTGVLTTCLVSILAIHLFFGDRRVDERLRLLAEKIETSFSEEVDGALGTLRAVVLGAEFSAELSTIKKGEKTFKTKTNLLAERDLGIAEYPYFSMVFASDEDGWQRIKWTVRDKETPQLSVSERYYFQAVKRDDFWHLRGESATDRRFRVDPIFSWNTGEYLAVVSRPASTEDSVLSLYSIVIPLMSLIHPILPPDNGFAVVDPLGSVLFHSDPTRNGSENFFDEIEDDRELRAALETRLPAELMVRYLNSPHRLFVTPLTRLSGCPWTLIVFRDLEKRDSQQILSIWLVLVLTLVYVTLLGVVAWLMPLPAYPPAAILPSSGQVAAYYHLIAVLLVALVLSYRLIFELPAVGLLIALAALPASAVTVTVLKLQERNRAICAVAVVFWLVVFGIWLTGQLMSPLMGERGPVRLMSGGSCVLLSAVAASYAFLSLPSNWFRRVPAASVSLSYAFVAVLLLAMSALIPVCGFFRLSHDYYESLFARDAQIETRGDLGERQERVKEEYRDIRLGEPHAEVAKWLFLRRRLDLHALDRYDSRVAEDASLRYCSNCWSSTDESWRNVRGILGAIGSWLPSGGVTLTDNLHRDDFTKGEWIWNDQGGRLRFRRAGVADPLARSPETAALSRLTEQPGAFEFESLDMVTDLRFLRWQDLPKELWFLGLVFTLLLWLWLRRDTTAIFGLEFEPGSDWGELDPAETPIRENTVLVGALGCSRASARERARTDITWIDLAKPLDEQIQRLERHSTRVVGLEQFEAEIQDVDRSLGKVEFVESLLYGQTTPRNLLILTTVDPVFLVSEELPPTRDLPDAERRKREELARRCTIFKSFAYRRRPLPDTTSRQYPALWSACTRTEKAALYQLATQGWPNFKNESALRHLEGRGVIQTRPGVRILDAKLREFIRDSIDDRAVRGAQSREAPSAWQGIRVALVMILLGVLGMTLYISRNEFIGIALSALSLLAPAMEMMVAARRAQAALGSSEASGS